MARLVVYTAIFGGFDTLEPALCRVPHICFTDRSVEVEGWEIRVAERKFEDPRKEARFYKTHAHKLLETKTSIWVDGHIRIKGPQSLLEYMRGGIALHSHRRRKDLYEEGEFCVKVGKADSDIVQKQLARYRAEGYPEGNGLVETGLLVRDHVKKVNVFNGEWWKEIARGSSRDQISFNYVAWKLGQQYGIVPGKIYRNPVLVFHKHSKL